VPWTLDRIREEVTRTLAAAGNEDSYIRIIVTRGSGPLNYDPTTAEDPQVVIIVTPLRPQPPGLYADGVEVCLVRASRPTDDSQATGAKASNYLVNLLATHEVRQRGGYEAILLGPNGQILEGATSNIFIVRDGIVRTPRAEAGILVGITRQTVIRVASNNIAEVIETALFPQDLYDAEEAFITSSLREVVGVVRVDGRQVGDGRPGPVTRRLHEAYLEAVRDGATG
jgi:branched-chain amino acid aminotransferase